MDNKIGNSKADKKAVATNQGARSQAEQRVNVGKFPPLLETWDMPFTAENLTRVTNQKVHEGYLAAKADSLIATCEQLTSTLTARAATSSKKTFEPTLLTVLALRATNALAHLASVGNDAAAHGLLQLASLAAVRLDGVTRQDPSRFKAAACERLDWPVMYSPHTYWGTDVEELQNTLEVGGSFQLGLLTKRKDRKQRFDLEKPQNETALRALGVLARTRSAPQAVFEVYAMRGIGWANEARKLPAFAPETAGQWAKVGWKLVLAAYGGNPEKDPFFKSLGESISEELRKPSAVRGRIGALVRNAIKKFAKPASSTK